MKQNWTFAHYLSILTSEKEGSSGWEEVILHHSMSTRSHIFLDEFEYPNFEREKWKN
jgi:hypothetical protein